MILRLICIVREACMFVAWFASAGHTMTVADDASNQKSVWVNSRLWFVCVRLSKIPSNCLILVFFVSLYVNFTQMCEFTYYVVEPTRRRLASNAIKPWDNSLLLSLMQLSLDDFKFQYRLLSFQSSVPLPVGEKLLYRSTIFSSVP